MKNYEERTRLVAEKMEVLNKRKTNRRGILAGISLCLLLVLVVSLFIPYDKELPSVDQHARSPYYKVIQKINELNYTPPAFDNAFGELVYGAGSFLDGVQNVLTGGHGTAAAPGDAMPEADQYVEVTDNQVQGVTEADIFKRSERYLYYLHGTQLKVYSIAGAGSAQVGSFRVTDIAGGEDQEPAEAFYFYASEMYLSQDCTTVTLVLTGESKASGTSTVILNLDVTDPANIRQTEYVCFPGSLISTRMAEGKLLLTYNYRLRGEIDYDQPETFVPSYGKPGSMTCIDPEDILCPDTATSTRYTVICQLDGKTLAVQDTKALLSYAQELYVSENAIYATHSFTRQDKVDANVFSSKTMTRITGIGYGDKLQYLGSVDIEGSVKNQYAMDEYENILRVVTSTSYSTYVENRDEYTASVEVGRTRRNVSLYCIDLNAWEVEALVGGFAPEGETAESVRFDGPMAYVCTAEIITLSDPVYFFDLSDLEHITYTDTGTIDGYSTSLVQLGDGFLLGIGYGDAGQLKIEVYEEYQGKVVSVDAWQEEGDFSLDYKAYLILREEDMIGLAIYHWDTATTDYLLLHFDGYKLRQLQRIPLDSVNTNAVRACIIGQELYILNEDGLKVEKVW